MKKDSVDLNYYLTLYQLEGHTTWRASLSSHKKGFQKEALNINPKITDVLVYRIDRTTGSVIRQFAD